APTPPSPPSSTLFPYTTLFRSLGREGHAVGAGNRGYERAAPGDGVWLGHAAQLGIEEGHGHGGIQERICQRCHQPTRWLTDATEDRKSTRLNSSHVAISYAVFC